MTIFLWHIDILVNELLNSGVICAACFLCFNKQSIYFEGKSYKIEIFRVCIMQHFGYSIIFTYFISNNNALGHEADYKTITTFDLTNMY